MTDCEHPFHEVEIDMGAEGGLYTAPKHITYKGKCTACETDVEVTYKVDSITKAHLE